MRRRILKVSTTANVSSPNRPITVKPIKSTARETKPPIPTRNVQLNETTHFLERGKDRVFIVGGGPSLIGMDLSFLDNEYLEKL